jgi:predicted tellurium resistance membrane protein TerC
MLALLTDPNAWAALVTLTALEIVLGIDNVVFISVLVARLPTERIKRARQIGLSLALIFRIALLFALTALVKLRYPVVTILGNEISWHDIILIGGGFFLIAKATYEIHHEIEARHSDDAKTSASSQVFALIILQIVAIDLVFSIDSIVTAIGMAQNIEVMVTAVVIAVAVMYAGSGAVSAFIVAHPTSKMLALAFLLLIGMALVADGFDFHIPRGYIYSAMLFAGVVELFNVLANRRRQQK